MALTDFLNYPDLIKQNKNLLFLKSRFNHDDYGDYVRRLGTKITIKNKINAIGYLDADNTFEIDHFKTVLEKYNETGKKIVISQRNFISGNVKKNVLDKHEFFDTNQTLFDDKIKIGLLLGRYQHH